MSGDVTEADVVRAAQIMDSTVWRTDARGDLVPLPAAAVVLMKARQVLTDFVFRHGGGEANR